MYIHIVLQGNIPFGTARFKHFLDCWQEQKLGTRWAKDLFSRCRLLLTGESGRERVLKHLVYMYTHNMCIAREKYNLYMYVYIYIYIHIYGCMNVCMYECMNV